MTRPRIALLAILAVILAVTPAWADQAKTFAVLPFAINGPDKFAYLSQGVQDMLNSRLTWQGKFQPMDKAAVDQKAKSAPRSDADAKAAMGALKADFLVYGSMTITGDEASLDVKVMDKSGNVTPKTAQTKLNTIVPTMDSLAKDINTQVFKRPEQAKDEKTGQPVQKVNQMNPAFVVNQNAANQEVYLNPNFRYAGDPSETEGYWRSQSLPFAANGMAIGDVQGDGKNNVVLITDSEVLVYRYDNRQLMPVAKWQGPPRVKFLRVSVLPLGADTKKCKIVVCGYFDKLPLSTILSFDGKQLVVEQERIPYYLAAATLPPNFKKQLVGSRGDKKDLFGSGVYEMNFMSGKLETGPKLDLPSKANPFNFTYLPDPSGYKLVLVDDGDHLLVHTPKNDVQAKTEETYCGSSLGLEYDTLMTPLTTPEVDYLWNYYYVPLPLLATTLGPDKKPELLVSKNISIASQFFENFRYFSQGEIHSLVWDGVGLNLKWKTRRIKGTIEGYDVADMANDGKQDLVVCINTYPGATGFKQRRTLVLSYAMDLESTKGGKFGNMEEVGE